MASYLFRRLALAIPTLWVVVTLVFFIFRVLVPGDPAELIAGELAPREVIESIRRQMGLDQPLPVQYVRYLSGLARGDLGVSKVFQQNAGEQLLARLPATLQLAGLAMLLAFVLGVAAGIVSAVRQSSWLDYLATLGAVGGVSIPSFWLGLMLIMLFSVGLGWLPTGGRTGPDSIILPAITLSAYQLAIIARMTRSSMLETLQQDYVRTARAKGVRERGIVLAHALRNALIPTVTIAGLQMGYLLGGSVIVETVFAWPGLGSLMIESIRIRDYTMVQAVALLFAAMFLLINILVDALYAYLDPRVHYA
ncbi:MAG: ABC transporter permease [Chloroflexi bacterium]|nr:ABC transporter permease [Chloroflexota bacterium]